MRRASEIQTPFRDLFLSAVSLLFAIVSLLSAENYILRGAVGPSSGGGAFCVLCGHRASLVCHCTVRPLYRLDPELGDRCRPRCVSSRRLLGGAVQTLFRARDMLFVTYNLGGRVQVGTQK